MAKIYIRSKQMQGVKTVKINGQCYYPTTTRAKLTDYPLTDISTAEAFYVGDCDGCEQGSTAVGVNQNVTIPVSSISSGKQFTFTTPPLSGRRYITVDNPPGPPIQIQFEIDDTAPGRFNPGNLVLDPVPLGSGPTVYTPPPTSLPQTKIYTQLPNNDVEVTLISTDPFVVTVVDTGIKTIDPLPAPTWTPPLPPGTPITVTPTLINPLSSGKENTTSETITFIIPSDQFPGPDAVVIPPTGAPIKIVNGPGTFTAPPSSVIFCGGGGSSLTVQPPLTGGKVTVGTPPSAVDVSPSMLNPVSTGTNNPRKNTTNPPIPILVKFSPDAVVVCEDGTTTSHAGPGELLLQPGCTIIEGTLQGLTVDPPISVPPGQVTVGTPPSAVDVSPSLLDPISSSTNNPRKNTTNPPTPVSVTYTPDAVVVCEDGTTTLHAGPGELLLQPGCVIIEGTIPGLTVDPPISVPPGQVTVGTPPSAVDVSPSLLDPVSGPPSKTRTNNTTPPKPVLVKFSPDAVVVCEDGTTTSYAGPGTLQLQPGCTIIEGTIPGVTVEPPPATPPGNISVGQPPVDVNVSPAYLQPISGPPAKVTVNNTNPPRDIVVSFAPDAVIVCSDGTVTGHRGPGQVTLPPGCKLIQGTCTALCDSVAVTSNSEWQAADVNWNDFDSTWE